MCNGWAWAHGQIESIRCITINILSVEFYNASEKKP